MIGTGLTRRRCLPTSAILIEDSARRGREHLCPLEAGRVSVFFDGGVAHR
jgi:hypothetical protein